MIAVTGATGHLGRKIVDELLVRVDVGEIVAVARSPEKASSLASTGVGVRRGDYEDVDSLVAAFEDVDTLMFISNSDIARRAEQHQNVIDAAQRARVGRVVYTSFASIEDDNILAASHRATEKALKDSGLAHTILRDNYYMDMYVVEVEIAMKTGSYRSPSGEAGAAFVGRSDIARAAAVVLTGEVHSGKVYEMTGPAVVKPVDFAAVAAELSGELVVYQPISWEELAEDYRRRGMAEDVVNMSIMLEKVIASNVLAEVSDDIRLLTGQQPESLLSLARKILA